MPDLIETGLEPEFFVTDIVRSEVAGNGGTMRLYVACMKHGQPIVQFTVVGSLDDFAKMAAQVLQMAADQHNSSMLMAGAAH